MLSRRRRARPWSTLPKLCEVRLASLLAALSLCRRVSGTAGAHTCSLLFSFARVAGDVEEVVEVLADSVTNPLLLEEDLQEQKIAVGNVRLLGSHYGLSPSLCEWSFTHACPRVVHVPTGRELEDMVHDPPSWLPEILHELAYGPEGLGLSHLCPPSNLEHIGREQLHNFVKTYYVGPRVVVAAAGVEHDSFVKLCAKHFDSLPAAEGGKPLHVPSVYKGYLTARLPSFLLVVARTSAHPLARPRDSGAHVEFMSPENEKRLQELQAESDKPPPSHVALVFEVCLPPNHHCSVMPRRWANRS